MSSVVAALPAARGPLSEAIIGSFHRDERGEFPELGEVGDADPFGEDVQLALYLCYELHYQGLAGVDPDWEWDPELLRLRAAMERSFLAGLRAAVAGGEDVESELDELLVEPVDGNGLSHFLAGQGEWWHLREYFVHRSVYHLKEADPHAWVIPRLRGRAKAALVAVEFDEFGGGRGDRVHARLYADLMEAAGLDAGYLHYLDRAPASMLAVVNLMSLFGLHRRLRGALVGHFAAAEITTAPSAIRLEHALTRLGAPAACTRFFTEHIEADAVHEQIMRHDVIGGLLTDEPELAADVVFGIQATNVVEARFTADVLSAWHSGDSSLR
ncbi:iron-containing redox enzyme family protein [Amycolatopsis pithecellobii]|uniref:Iron-containing redox enzyme family protein n=1 Tax=Amycolatopsis pithecellobii TaxID=664692 RepID=A0A6N7YKR4_9PSEU|nr:iron-containing redox enzyme family protein [Amycolatopsis pithecellobii]MTD53505.1 iron-containing redox enzyme family protein [Amycolatopsis pithecellobii]